MTSLSLAIPILEGLMPEGVRFGSVILVEFGPDSIWHEASYSIAAQAALRGIGTEYHTFLRKPIEVEEALTKLGTDVKRLENEKLLTIIDSYSPQIELKSQSLKLRDFDHSIDSAQRLQAGNVSEQSKHILHIDDDTSIFLQYNSENDMIQRWRTQGIPSCKATGRVALSSLLTGIASKAFYARFESMCDGLIDFKSEEREGQIVHLFRLRRMRGKAMDSRWRRLKLLDNGAVEMVD